jgi:hypothetical protein
VLGACGRQLAPVGADDHLWVQHRDERIQVTVGRTGCSMPTSSCSRSDTLAEKSGG